MNGDSTRDRRPGCQQQSANRHGPQPNATHETAVSIYVSARLMRPTTWYGTKGLFDVLANEWPISREDGQIHDPSRGIGDVVNDRW